VHIKFRYYLLFSGKYEKRSVEIEGFTVVKEDKLGAAAVLSFY
jgi:hypothetical protein